MKNSLFDVLMNFFEKTLAQIKSAKSQIDSDYTIDVPSLESDVLIDEDVHNVVIRRQKQNSIRVFTLDEQFKFTKASYQFIMRLMRLEIISTDIMELVINQLLCSDSAFVTLAETKWAIRSTLEDQLETEELAFLDLVLYQKDDQLPLH